MQKKKINNHWALFIRGNNEALGVVFKEYYANLVLQAYYLIQDQNAAEDIVSEIFTKLLHTPINKRIDTLTNVDEKLQSFLKVLVKHRCLDKIKVEKNRSGILVGLLNFTTYFSKSKAFEKENLELLLDTLPKRQQQVFQLHLDGFDNNEIAEQLSISYNTCRNTLSSSKKNLRNNWSTFFES